MIDCRARMNGGIPCSSIASQRPAGSRLIAAVAAAGPGAGRILPRRPGRGGRPWSARPTTRGSRTRRPARSPTPARRSLAAMLLDPAERAHATNIVLALGIAARPGAFEAIAGCRRERLERRGRPRRVPAARRDPDRDGAPRAQRRRAPSTGSSRASTTPATSRVGRRERARGRASPRNCGVARSPDSRSPAAPKPDVILQRLAHGNGRLRAAAATIRNSRRSWRPRAASTRASRATAPTPRSGRAHAE